MIKNVLEHLGGVAGYGIVSLCLFFALFAGIMIWTFRLKKTDLDAAAALPLQEPSDEPSAWENRYE
ncbi:MAG: CcoQ/FixQ family Cbb3-type cytochrome c oxidase assembly chaperone [Verrucomicrobia bacterium]|jgi:cbb3-type cytochrome oxidase subunit 3|nr:CcoQ/FixQ family Cbb3-type cytochrome c oxidase assembly chaperone [Verrucomicrobiota bacterium]